MASKITLVEHFLAFSEARLEQLGFAIDETHTGGPYGAFGFVFCDQRSLYLQFSISPYDSGVISSHFGRKWVADDGWWALSNYLYKFPAAQTLAYPKFHDYASSHRELPECYATIMLDLERVLPAFDKPHALRTLDAVEHDQYGVLSQAETKYGSAYLDRISVVRKNS